MAVDGTQLNPGTGGDIIKTDLQTDDTRVQVVHAGYGPQGATTRVDAGTPLPTTDAGLGAAGTGAAAISGTGVIGWLRSIYDKLAGTLTVGGTVTVSNLPATQPVSGTVSVGNLPATQPVSAAGLPLPAGAATDSNLTSLVGAAGATPPSLATSATGILGWLRKLADLLAGTLNVNVGNFPATQPVSGSVSVANLPATQPVSATALPLPAGAATDASLATLHTDLGHLTDGNLKLQPAAPTAFADTGTIASANYRGLSVKNTSATAAAEIAIRQTNVTGTILDTITLAAGESVREHYPSGRTTGGTIYMQLVSGAVSGSVFSS